MFVNGDCWKRMTNNKMNTSWSTSCDRNLTRVAIDWIVEKCVRRRALFKWMWFLCHRVWYHGSNYKKGRGEFIHLWPRWFVPSNWFGVCEFSWRNVGIPKQYCLFQFEKVQIFSAASALPWTPLRKLVHKAARHVIDCSLAFVHVLDKESFPTSLHYFSALQYVGRRIIRINWRL